MVADEPAGICTALCRSQVDVQEGVKEFATATRQLKTKP